MHEGRRHGSDTHGQCIGRLPGIQFLNALGVLFGKGEKAPTHSLMKIQGFLIKPILVLGLLSSGQPILNGEIE
jgi:hypothetical protein